MMQGEEEEEYIQSLQLKNPNLNVIPSYLVGTQRGHPLTSLSLHQIHNHERSVDLCSLNNLDIVHRTPQSACHRAQVLSQPEAPVPRPHCRTQRVFSPSLQLYTEDCLCGPPGISCDRISEHYWWLGGGDFTGQKFPFYNKHSQCDHVGDFLHTPHTYKPLVILTPNSQWKK